MEPVAKKKRSVKKYVLFGLGSLLVAFALYKLIGGYISSLPKYKYDYAPFSADGLAVYPDTRFAVLSDIHYYALSLGTEGAAFERTMQSDRKLLRQSGELIDKAVERLLNSDIEFLLISGDLTKDGERVNHEALAGKLQRLVDKGIKVYVVPGNHDVNSPDAVRYLGDKTETVENVSEEDFAAIYQNCGYGGAILRDPNTLSYVAEPTDGLWLVAVDSCESKQNAPGKESVVSGTLDQGRLDWLKEVLTQAKERKKAVMLMMHHGVTEHWQGQGRLHPDYLLSDYRYALQFLSSYGARVVFTGHYHAQDVTLSDNGDKGFIYDVETGSLVTPPCSMRLGNIVDNRMTLNSEYFINDYSEAFKKDALEFVKQTIYNEAYGTLKKYRVSGKDADYLATAISEAYVAHYDGNETGKAAVDTAKLSLWGKLIYSQYSYVVEGLWKDLPPADAEITFSLAAP